MSIFTRIKDDRIKAMKDRNSLAKGILSSLVGDLETMSKNLGQETPTDEQTIKKIKSYISNAESNMELTSDSDKRDDFAYEIGLLNQYVPQQLDDEALRTAIKIMIKKLAV